MDMPSSEERRRWREKVEAARKNCTDLSRDTAYIFAENDFKYDKTRRRVGLDDSDFQKWYDEKFYALENGNELLSDEELREELNETLRMVWLSCPKGLVMLATKKMKGKK